MLMHNHPFHMVNQSPWPLTGAIATLIMVSGLTKWFHQFSSTLMTMGTIVMIFTVVQWWRDIIRESTIQGNHTNKVIKGLQWGMILFITSEVFFFVSFFWAFFHSSLSPAINIGSMWPPMGIETFNPIQIPLLNTAILLTSGVTITWAHHGLMENNYAESLQGLMFTVMLGIYFSILQAYEYVESAFTISDSIYGSSFFMATGFHGIHVIIGTTFILNCLIRHYFFHFSSNHHFGFEAAAWYWHFVDVVWLFLYISLYWWGS
uniref:Cytochrome c oxidase subunit 3 n=1 Tax=Timema californicum TaxID=61474 RepID=Q2Q1H7_TIMCA|nr:cytochrome c oxidase subunit III [Timema californicum]